MFGHILHSQWTDGMLNKIFVIISKNFPKQRMQLELVPPEQVKHELSQSMQVKIEEFVDVLSYYCYGHSNFKFLMYLN